MSKMTIESLLEAAERLERGDINLDLMPIANGCRPVELASSGFVSISHSFERTDMTNQFERDHGYASTQPVPYQRQRQRPKTRKFQGSLHRHTHNELEKSRRANLRRSLDRLKALVPLGPNDSRHTTLGLLEKAQGFIKNLEENWKKNRSELDQLASNRDFWRQRLDQLVGGGGDRYRQRDESSPVSVTDSNSSEQDVDVIGYINSCGSQSSEGEDVSSDGDYFAQTLQLHLGD